MIETNQLVRMALAAPDMPWGMGSPILANGDEAWVPYYRFLHLVVAAYKPDVVVECGSYKGMAAGHMAWACPDTLVISIDIDPRPELMIIAAHFRNIRVIKGDTTEASTYRQVRELARGRRLELLFLDSAHDGLTPAKEFDLYYGFMGNECLVACDDILSLYADEKQQAAMQSFWHNLPGEKLDFPYLHDSYGDVRVPGFGVSIVRRKS